MPEFTGLLLRKYQKGEFADGKQENLARAAEELYCECWGHCRGQQAGLGVAARPQPRPEARAGGCQGGPPTPGVSVS